MTAFRIGREGSSGSDAGGLRAWEAWAERGSCDLMTGDRGKLHPVVCRLDDRRGRAVADCVSRGATPRAGSPAAGFGGGI
jgi:hypothetical protein